MNTLHDVKIVLKQVKKVRVNIEENDHSCILDVVDVYLDQAENELLNIISELEADDDECSEYEEDE